MKKGLYKCTHCGNVAWRSSTGRNNEGIAMGVRCERCQFDTLRHESWWMQGADKVVGAQEEYFSSLRREFEGAMSKQR